MIPFGQNVSNVVQAIRNRMAGGMNQFRTNLGNFRENAANRRQAAMQGFKLRLAGEDPTPYTTPYTKMSSATETLETGLQTSGSVPRRVPEAPQPFSREQLLAAGIKPENWVYGTPSFTETPEGKYWRIKFNPEGTQFSFTDVNSPVYSTEGHAIPSSLLSSLRDAMATGRAGPVESWRITQLIDEILASQQTGISEDGPLRYVSPSALRRLKTAAESVGFDWAPAEEWWNREAGAWYGKPNEIPGTVLMGPENTWEDWERLPGFGSEMAKFLSSQGITPGPDYAGAWDEYGRYNPGVENTDLNNLLDTLAQYMQTTPLGTSAAVDPNLISQILSATGRGGQMWAPSEETDYLANIQPMVSLPMGY